jgi:rhodanese-related sulfurtransferase
MGLRNIAFLILLFMPFVANSQQNEPYMIDAAKVARAMKTNPGSFYLIDVRSREERQQMNQEGLGSIPGTHGWLPVDESQAQDPKYWAEYEKKLLQITGGKKDAHIVLYCFFQVHSYPIGGMLMSRGFPNIYSLVNGIRSWYSQ